PTGHDGPRAQRGVQGDPVPGPARAGPASGGAAPAADVGALAGAGSGAADAAGHDRGGASLCRRLDAPWRNSYLAGPITQTQPVQLGPGLLRKAIDDVACQGPWQASGEPREYHQDC